MPPQPNPKNVIRLNDRPYIAEELSYMACEAYRYGYDDLTIALNIDWQTMYDIRKEARRLLRTSTGEKADEDGVIQAAKREQLIFVKKGEVKQLWQEGPITLGPEILILYRVFDRLIAKFPCFQPPLLVRANGTPAVDAVQLVGKEYPDPANPGSTIAQPTLFMRMKFLERIVQKEVDTMRRNPLARTALTEADMKFPIHLRSQDLKHKKARTGKAQPDGRGPYRKRRILLWHASPDEEGPIEFPTPPLAEMLRRSIDEYPASGDFPLEELSEDKLWRAVSAMMGGGTVQALQAGGWLRYAAEVDDGHGATQEKVWRVEDGEHLALLLRKHDEELYAGEDQTGIPLKLEYRKGACTETLQEHTTAEAL